MWAGSFKEWYNGIPFNARFLFTVDIIVVFVANAVMPTLPLLAGDLRFFASSPALPLWYINLPLFTSTINIEYLVKNKTDLVWDLAHF